MRFRPLLTFGPIAALSLLAGCAAPPPPPLLDISRHPCSAIADLINAAPLPLGDALHPKLVEMRIDDSARCLETAEGKSLYGAFRLPDSTVPIMVAVRSIPVGEGLFVPRLLLLDGTGALKREIGQDSLEFRGNTLTALIRIHPDELYLVVASTPKTVGQGTSRITEGVNASTYSANGGYFTVYSGTDSARSFVYAQGGRIIVYAATVPGS
jgi:hypothetical protein